MRAPPNAPAAKPRRSKRQSATNATTPARKKGLPVNDEVAQDDAPELGLIDNDTADGRGTDSNETLPELEREIGIADWIDPQTGEPAEGQSPPHLDDE